MHPTPTTGELPELELPDLTTPKNGGISYESFIVSG
jgi:hypothetical protein